MAKIIVAGRIGTAQMKAINGEKGQYSLLSCSIADAEVRSEGEDPWYNFALSGKYAETMEQYLKKGVSVMVSGGLKTSSFKKKDGTEGFSRNILRPEIVLLGSRSDNSEAAPTSTPATPTSAPADDGFMNIPDGIDEELPFN